MKLRFPTIIFLLFFINFPNKCISTATCVIYSNIGYTGSYCDVSSMDENSGACTQKQTQVNGEALSPLDEELSVHFRGPIHIKQFGVYVPGGGGMANAFRRRHIIEPQNDDGITSEVHHRHKRSLKEQQVVFLNDSKIGNKSLLQHKQITTGSWNQIAYYAPGSLNNIVFLNHQGGSSSGTFSYAFGNSLSYASSDGTSCASSPQMLSDSVIGSNVEVIAFSNSKCNGITDCGYYRNNTVAYHGFGGSDKMFVFEFSMPHGYGGNGPNQDMPAVWLLNAKIPRTLQYGKSSCSCWSTGCGELDLFEIISTGSNDLTSTLHDGQGKNMNAQGGGGSSDTFARPTDDTSSRKFVVIFNSNDRSIHLVELDENDGTGTFSGSLSGEQVSSWLNKQGTNVNL